MFGLSPSLSLHLSLSIDVFVSIERSPQEGDCRSLYRARIITHKLLLPLLIAQCCTERCGGIQHDVAGVKVKSVNNLLERLCVHFRSHTGLDNGVRRAHGAHPAEP